MPQQFLLIPSVVETRAPAKRTGIRLGRETREIRLAGNQIEGFAEAIADLRGG